MRDYDLHNGTLTMLKDKYHYNHSVRMVRKAYYAHVSRKPEWVLILIGILWKYLGWDFGAKR